MHQPVLVHEFLDIRIQMQADSILALFHFQSQERFHGLSSCHIKVLCVQGLEFLLELLGGGYCGEVVHKYPNEDKILIFLFHEDGLLVVDGKILVLLHPVGEPDMPGPCRLPCTIDILSELHAVSFWD